MNRTETRPIFVNGLQIGGQDKVIIQSMTNTKTKDIEATLKQIRALESFGCQMIRLAILDEEDALAIKTLVKEAKVPLVADIHFNYKLALLAIENGIHKIRLNPGNIQNKDHIQAVVQACKAKNVPIRIGINAGSLEKSILAKYNNVPCAQAMIESAQNHVKILTDLDFHDIALSFKSSDVRLTIDVYEKASKIFPYPLHLGVTEAGTLVSSSIKSSAALGVLLHQGIGDTIRISISDDPTEEVKVAKQLLRAFGLYSKVADLVACPTCGRLQYDMLPIVKEIESYLESIQKDITVAVMGCAVNGPQEASRADLGVAGGFKEALLFKKGQFIRSIPQQDIVSELKLEIERYIIENKL